MSAIKISTKPFDEEVVVAIDPYKPDAGAFPRSITANIVLFSRGEEGAVPLSGEPFVISTPGEYEVKGILITAVESKDGQIVYRVDAENMSVGHLGLSSVIPEGNALETISGVDILCLPVGGKGTYDTETAVKVANAIESRVIVPIAFASDNTPNALPGTGFLKEMGVAQTTPEKKLVLKKKDLPQEDVKVILLEKE